MTRAQALNKLSARLPAHEARALLAGVLKEAPAVFFARLREPLPEAAWEKALRLAERRARGEPLQLLLGFTEFFGLPLALAPGVLIPRPETEGLVERALRFLEPRPRPRVLDVGTGSGAIALAIKARRPDARVFASDVSRAALELARKNARQLGLEVAFLHAPLTAGLTGLDLIVSNPPYLPEEDRETAPPELGFEPETALFAGEEGLDVARPLAKEALRALRPGGGLLLELDPRNVFLLAAELPGLGYRDVGVGFDLSGRARYLFGRRPGTASAEAAG